MSRTSCKSLISPGVLMTTASQYRTGRGKAYSFITRATERKTKHRKLK